MHRHRYYGVLARNAELDPERLFYESNKPGPGGNGPLLDEGHAFLLSSSSA